MPRPVAVAKLMLWLVCCGALLPADSRAATYFSTDFNAMPLHVALGEDVNGSYTVKTGTSLSGSVLHCATCGEGLDRRYVRTIDSDYHATDFVYEITLSNSGEGISFVGMGEGTGYTIGNEPANAVFWRVLDSEISFGYREGANQVLETVSSTALDTAYRARITKEGSLIHFQLDEHADGSFEFSPTTMVDLNSTTFDFLDPTMHGDRGRLFFGTAFPHREFDNLDVTQVLLGDMNLDGTVDAADVPLFVMALTDREEYESQWGMSPDVRGDVDGSGTFDLGDVASFSQLATILARHFSVCSRTARRRDSRQYVDCIGIASRRSRLKSIGRAA